MNKDSLITNAFFSTFSGIIGKAGALIFTIILARMLVPELFGVYSLVLSIVVTLATLSDLGLSTTMTRYLSSSKTDIQRKSNFQFLLKAKILMVFLVAILLFVFSKAISSMYKTSDISFLLKIGAVYLIFTSLYAMFGAIFLAYQKVRYATFMDTVFQVSRVLVVGAFLLAYKDISLVFVGLTLAAIFTFVSGLVISIIKYPFLFKGEIQKVERKRMLNFSGFILLGSLGIMIFANIDKLILGYFVQPEFLGYYTVILTLLSGAIGLFSFAGVLFPRFTEISEADLKILFKKAFYYLGVLVFPATIGLAYLSVPLMRFLYGDNYVPLIFPTTFYALSFIMAFLLLEAVISGIYKTLLNAREKPHIPAYSTGIAALLNIVLNFVLIYYLVKISPIHALLGAGIATVASRYFALFFLIGYSSFKLKITPNFSSVFKPVIASVLMFIPLIFLRPYFTSWKLFILVIIAVILYFTGLFIIKGLNISEIKYVLSQIKPNKK